MQQGTADAHPPRRLPPALARAWALTARPTPLQVGVVAGLLLTLLQAIVRNAGPPMGDDRIYELIADEPFEEHTFPFAYRVGVPVLVHVLPFDQDVSFTLIALLSMGAAAGFLHALMTTLEIPARLSAGLCLLFAISPGVIVVLLRNARNVDATTLLVMCAAAYFIVRRRGLALCVTLALGAFVRESAMFLIPFAYAVWAERWIDLRVAARVLLLALPAVAIYATLRLAVPTVGRELVIGYGQSFLDGRETVVTTALDGWRTALRRVFLAFGPLWLLAPFALARMRYAQRGLVLVACCVAAMGFALDWGRVLLLAAPVIYPAAGWVLARRPRLAVPVLALWLAICLGYAAYMDLHGVESNIDGGGDPTYPVQ